MDSIVNRRCMSVLAMTCSLMLGLSSCAKDSEQYKSADQEHYSATSPDERIGLTVSWDTQTSPQYSVTFNNTSVLLPSNIDLFIKGEQKEEHDLVLLSQEEVDETYALPWGQFSHSRNQYTGVKFQLVNKITNEPLSVLEFRVFNDAVAFRHVFESIGESKNQILLEQTHFNFAQDASTWSYNGMKPNKHIKSIASSAAEQIMIPTAVFGEKLPAMAIQEASRFETEIMQLTTLSGRAELAVISQPLISNALPSSTAWRVLQIGDKAGDLLTSQSLINLSPANQIEDISWIKPGKSLWDWRVRGDQYGDHTYALDNESLHRMIDFAAKSNMQYVMIDANWYGPEHQAESDPFTEIDGLNIKDLINQANQKGIGFILYLNDKASVNYDLDKLFETWASWGAAGVKYGFMKLSGREKVLKTLNIVELAAKHKLLINFHDQPIVPSGLRRAWPNWLTREAVHAQADGLHTFTPSGFVEMAHVNALAGPLDMSNGFFKLNGLKESRKYVRSDVNSTVAGEVARALIIFSGLIIFPDSPEEYLRKPDLFEFFQHMPATWDESKVLSSNIEHHVVTARKTGEDWFVGAAINEEGGELPLQLDFLADNHIYTAKIYADTAQTHYLTNREAYAVRAIEVKKGDVIKMSLAPGGGQAIWLSPVSKGTKK
ncbi:hypothetical protein GLIP_0471 [Aliiglaciecola lipolytica E3]|uniref:Alpha-glucosidase n=1 Tax=Aliiglaciecola lipolytica E3 TaxID=1127673 RepID=K6Y4C7_9ALTE|nr:glycoside hydrolase family 97 protein [Aliiglaciecola lipolytica]GAC13117.1 hypothetical protein GLIP_0471 [Aliiglaciecola lipolytica E3]